MRTKNLAAAMLLVAMLSMAGIARAQPASAASAASPAASPVASSAAATATPSADPGPGCARDGKPRETLDEFIAAFERGDLAALGTRLDPSMMGYAHFLEGASLDFNRSKLPRIHLFDTAWQCGPDLVVLQTAWEKRFLDAVSYRPQLVSGRMSVLLFRASERWRIAAVAGPHPFGASAGAVAEISFGPTVEASAGVPTAVPLQLVVTDPDLVRRGSVEVLLRSSHGDREVFTLPAVAPGRFQRPTLPIAVAPAVPNNGVLEVQAGGNLQLEFVDEQPGEARPATVLRRSAIVTGVSGAIDTTPDPFFFGATTPQPAGTAVNSVPVVIRGINRPAPIGVAGGSYSINGGAFTTVPGTVVQNDQVRARVTISPLPGGLASATVTVGGVSGAFTVATAAAGPGDIDPDPFILFIDTSTFAANTLYSFNPITVQGISVPVTVSMLGGDYAINGGPFTSAPGTVREGDVVAPRFRASPVVGGTVTVTLTIGSRSYSNPYTTSP